MTDYDVVIAGLGPTGAVAANLLGAAGIRTLVVDPNPTVYNIPRAVHFDGEVMRTFQSLNLHTQISEVAAPGVGLGFTNGRNWKLFEQDLSILPKSQGWNNSNFFNQPALEAHLRTGLERYSSVTCALGDRVSDIEQTQDHVVINIASGQEGDSTGRQVSARYLLGCDGAASTIRNALAIEQEDLDCDEPWLVVDWFLPGDVEINRRAYQICDPNRPATLVPCEGSHIRWEFMVNEGDDLKAIEEEANVRQLMAPHLHRLSPELTSDMGELVRSKVYNFHALIAERFQTDRIFLLGDAAHQTPPFLGQGMCAGIRDADNLCWKIVGVLQGKYPPGLLSTYTTERRPHVYEVIKTAVGHGSVIQNRNHIAAFFRDCYLMLGRLVPLLVSFLRFDLSWSLGVGLLSPKKPKDAVIGKPIPQFELDGREPPTFSDSMLGKDFTLIGIDIDPSSLIDSQTSDINIKSVIVGPNGDIIDSNNSFSTWGALHDIKVLLVRPDRQVFGYCNDQPSLAANVAALVNQLESQLNSTITIQRNKEE
ncbi:MAG: bifunctional 3-(3-hydroxy-phenyl)propionate/3-hydroxycinnamic acid hydroxylase [Pseudomonadales bacterium]|nr:bifunctional 3-(3-hydroxy-phenyl)propionate/3-hydroxycinnamic acid hydroxylase [Pseudomonadales bacterium]